MLSQERMALVNQGNTRCCTESGPHLCHVATHVFEACPLPNSFCRCPLLWILIGLKVDKVDNGGNEVGAFRIFRILDFECFGRSAFCVAGAAASQQRPATSPGPISWSSRAKEAGHHLRSNHLITFDQLAQFF